MATWKKVVVSGSSAELAGLTVDATISGDISGNAGGNAASATQLANARTIAGVSFDGTANISLNNNAITNGAGYITSGGSISGNAATATQLQTARTIGGVSFDGTANIDLPGVNTAGNQNTSGTAAGLSSTLAITSGGTGAASRQAAIDALTDASSASEGQVLSIDGSGNAVFAAAATGDVTGIDAGTGITVTDGNTATPTVSVSDAGITGTQLNASVAGNGLAGGAGSALSVNVDDSSIEINADTLRIKASGVTNDMLNGSIANGKLANSTISGVALGNNLSSLSVDDSSIEYSVGSSFNGSAASTIRVKDGGITNDMLNGSIANGKLASSAITIAGQSVSLGSSITADTIAGQISADGITQAQVSGLDTSLAAKADTAGPTFTGTVAVDVLTASGNVTLGGDLTDQVTVNGDLTVKGTASFESTENLLVKDRFITLASGSTDANGDGGIVVETSTANGGQGPAFAWNGGDSRWGVAQTVQSDASSYTTDAFMAAVLKPAAANTAAAILAIDSNYNKKGNIYVSSGAQDIWIYS